MESHELDKSITSALEESGQACTKLSELIREAADHLRAGEIQEGNGLLAGILDDFSFLVTLITDVGQHEPFVKGLNNETSERIETECTQMVDQLKMVLDAQEDQDWVFLADLLEYELSERVSSWSGFFDGLSKAGA